MGATVKTSGCHGWHPSLPGMVIPLAVIGSALGLLAALLVGGSSGVWSFAANSPPAPECGVGLISLGGHSAREGLRQVP